MTRPWGKLHAATLTSRKFMRSSPEERGAWVTLLLYAFNSTSDDDLGTDADVEAILRREGFPDPARILARLIELGWIDRRRRRTYLHDWADWQPVDPTGAMRKRRSRERSGPLASDERPGTVSELSRDSHVTVPPQRREEKNRSISPLPPFARGRGLGTPRPTGRGSFDDLLEHDEPRA